MKATSEKPPRLSYRTNGEIKSLIQKAANLLGQTETSFAISTLAERAREVVDGHTITRVSARDWDAINALLKSEEEPGARLKEAAATFKHQSR